ncbi:hypothetical protein HY626_01035 [Candidatus Uhrbacteria bacterium]|nr:hypothetical protein [Candidatus Uhrbacteria bacterium]
MKKILIFLSLLLFAGLGCAPTTVSLADDFKPVEGKASSPTGEDSSKEGPYERRVMTAISYDGLSYTENGTWIADQAHVPDAVIKNDTIYLYYTGWIVGDHLNTSAVAISEDQGQTWTYKYVNLENAGSIDRLVDPDIVLLEDGTFRLFFTAGNPQGIHYAEGTDGITFAYMGSIFAQTDDIAIDSTTIKIGDTWHMYALSGEGINRLWHLTSTDGLSFTVYDLISFPNAGVPSMPSNGIWIDNKFYLFLYAADGSIGSMWTKNGFDWYPSEQTHLQPTENELYVKDPTVVQLDNGQNLMFYVTNIP